MRAVFLDRDGTLNEPIVREGRPYPPPSVAELELVPHASESLRRLKEAGFALVVVTNQPDVARGVQSRTVVEQINAHLAAQLNLDDVRTCWHDDSAGCACRKPKPGLLVEASVVRGIDLTRSFMVGDRWRDIEAGRAAGCRTVLIDRHYSEQVPYEPDIRVRDLPAAVDWILGAPNDDSSGKL